MKDFDIQELSQFDGLNMLCSQNLGSGIHRSVFVNRFDPKKVVKIATNPDGIRANIEEYNTWVCIQGTNVSSWFAACYEISDHGVILIQEYIPDIPEGSYKVPHFFTDIKRQNFGLIVAKQRNQVVCRDYGLNLIREKGMGLRLKSVKF